MPPYAPPRSAEHHRDSQAQPGPRIAQRGSRSGRSKDGYTMVTRDEKHIGNIDPIRGAAVMKDVTREPCDETRTSGQATPSDPSQAEGIDKGLAQNSGSQEP